MSIREIREAKGLSMDQLAKMVGTTRQSIWNYENGSHQIRLDSAQKIAQALECSIEDVLDNQPIPKTDGVYKKEDFIPLTTALKKVTLTELEQKLLEKFAELPFDDKLKVFDYLAKLKK